MTVEMVTAMGALLPAHKRKIRGTFSVRADAGGDVKAMIADLNRDWNEFKATLDEKDKELAKKFDDYVTTDKLEKINSSVGDLQSAIDAANARLQAIALGAGQENAVDDQEYTEAFQAYFKKEHIHANLNKGAADEGGYLAPVEWDRTITDSLIEVSPMRQIASIQQISTAGFKKLFNLRGTASGWVGETTARTETNTPTFGEMTYTPGEIYANPAATQQMLDDAAVNLEMWLAGEVETEFAFQEGLAFVSGDGTNKPAGVLTYATGAANAGVHPLGAIEVHTAAAAAAVTTDEILELTYLLPSAFTQNARFTMNRATQGEVRKLKDGQGNYIWQPSFTAGQPATLVNYPVTEMAAMPNMATTAMPIAFGDFRRGYLIVDRTGVRVLRDPFTNKPFVQFYTTKRVGGGLLNPETLKILQMG
ncbi:MAG: phage major capsid protein [bacterium]|nr:phage major capsid protein [bacterium]